MGWIYLQTYSRCLNFSSGFTHRLIIFFNFWAQKSCLIPLSLVARYNKEFWRLFRSWMLFFIPGEISTRMTGGMWHKEQGKEQGWAGCWGLTAQDETDSLLRDFSLWGTWINSWIGWMNIRGVLDALVHSLCVDLIQCLLQKKAIVWG